MNIYEKYLLRGHFEKKNTSTLLSWFIEFGKKKDECLVEGMRA